MLPVHRHTCIAAAPAAASLYQVTTLLSRDQRNIPEPEIDCNVALIFDLPSVTLAGGTDNFVMKLSQCNIFSQKAVLCT